MNRNNLWIRITIVAIVVSFAAVLGQIQRWRSDLRPAVQETVNVDHKRPKKPKRPRPENEPEILVKFKTGVSNEVIRDIAARSNDRIEDRLEIVDGLYSVDDLDNADVDSLVDQYAAMTDLVDYAQPNYELGLDPLESEATPIDLLKRPAPVGAPNDPQFSDQWALNNGGGDGGKERADIDALQAWLATKGSKKVVVAVLDSGVDYRHKDLVANMWIRPDSLPQYTDNELGTFDDRYGFDADANLADPMDDNGHGTHCAGVIGAEGNNGIGIAGINWEVQIMPLKFLGRSGFGSTKNAIEAINYAVDRKKKGVNVRIISASWGSTSRSKALGDAIKAAGDAGILFVAAAGNASTDNDKRPHYPSNYDLPNVISVAALDRSDNLASFSNYGAKTVHIAAPGKDIISTWLNDDFRGASGTSMATPHVAGVAALILAKSPNLSVAKLRERLLNSVDKLDSLDGKVSTGGRLNAAKAIGN